jgi:hypothetical protein
MISYHLVFKIFPGVKLLTARLLAQVQQITYWIQPIFKHTPLG